MLAPPLLLLFTLSGAFANSRATPVRQELEKRQGQLSLVSTGIIATASITVSPTPTSALASSVSGSASSGASGESSAKGEKAASESAASATSSSSSAEKGNGKGSEKGSSNSTESTTTSSASSVSATAAASSNSTSSTSSNSTASASGNSTAPAGNADLTVLNLALTLENLEAQFYSAALAAFPLDKMVAVGLSSTQATIVLESIQEVQADESTHASTLSGAIKSLGAQPFDKCTFNLGTTLADPLTFLSVARTVEAVGVGAYLGAASLVTDKTLLTAAASILTLEARHQSLLNTFSGGSFAAQPFDIALSPPQVLALAGGFLQDCQASDLQLTSNPPLAITDSVTNSTRFQVGSKLSFQSTVDLQNQSLSCQMIVGGAAVALVFDAANCVVPAGIDGPVAVHLTKSNTPLQTSLQTQNSADIVAGAGLIFVDSKTTTLSTLFTVTGNNAVKGALASSNMGAMVMNKMMGTTISIVQQSSTFVTSSTQVTVQSAAKKERVAFHKLRKVRGITGSHADVGARVLGWN